jgi:mannitol-specific phosphotransferase system IIBC component
MDIDKKPLDKPAVIVDEKATPVQAAVPSPSKVTTAAAIGAMDSGGPVSPGEFLAVSNNTPSVMQSEVTTKVADTLLTKMEVATAIFKRMRKSKGTTRKEIIEKFVEEAKLSKAGAATYYQLIKAKVR